jgi:fermentation-respiration switch protein FrsA (DUF1100 family)
MQHLATLPVHDAIRKDRGLPGMFLNLLGVAVLAYGALAAYVYFGQDRLVYFPEIGREIRATPGDVGLAYETLTLETGDGEQLHAWFVPHEQGRATVILFHGNAGNISHRLEYLAMFHRMGLSTLIFDYRGYGRSTGKPSEKGLYRDAEAAWKFAAEERSIPADRIVLFGESLGGAVAAWLAARQRPGALVLASVFTSVPDMGSELYPWLPIRWLARMRYDTRAALTDVTCPVLVAHSPEDEIVPFSHGRELFAAAPQPKAFLELAGGHNEGFVFARPDWEARVAGFLDEYLDKVREDPQPAV